VHGFIALDCPLRRGKRPKPHSQIYATIHKPVILFYDIIQIFALLEETTLREQPFLLEGLEGQRICRVLIDRNDTWCGRMAGA
jgi:hypothetical protein